MPVILTKLCGFIGTAACFLKTGFPCSATIKGYALGEQDWFFTVAWIDIFTFTKRWGTKMKDASRKEEWGEKRNEIARFSTI